MKKRTAENEIHTKENETRDMIILGRARKDKEFIAYEKFKSMLSEEQMDMFEKFLEEQAIQEGVKRKGVYSRGFKIGLLIGLETAKFSPED